ncbi:restriction endonuclease subunit S [Segatella oris]|uniref:Type I restriction-modification enzyme, S subunit, EcoA family n=2 Tax=Segatella TaxID=2974251 RepID=D7NG48_9BACT|nr:restriction endonuclease subunit S [Segatella oris]EFI47436.1 type I restriction-modification enzyme, S subunit, EcoA family [Segatella oris C735]
MRFPEFEGEWQEKRLSDIADLSKGIGISKDQLSADGEPCILYGELYTKYKSETIKEVISKTNIDNTKLVKSKANDVIIPCSGETAEEIATARCVLKDDILLGGDLNIIRLHGYDGSFMSYQLNGKRKYDIAKVAQGVSVVHLYGEHLKNIKTINPSLNEQKKIANLLSLLDERISTQNKIIDKLQSLIKGISNRLLYADNSMSIRIEEMLIERSERTKKNNQYEVLSSTVNGIFSQRDYFSKDIASDNNVGYKIIHLHDIVLSPQNLWMGNINFNDKFDIGIVSPSYKVFSIADGFDKKYVAALLKTHHALYNYMLVSEQGASIVRRNLNYEAFEQLVFKIPSLNKQREIGHAISLLKSRLENANLLIKTYNSQKQFMIRQMFI